MKPISPELRQRYDELFFQVISSAQAEVQATQPAQSGPIAQMFHKEQVKGALQNLAQLIAAWNGGQVDTASAQKCAGTLRGLGLDAAAERVSRLERIDESGG